VFEPKSMALNELRAIAGPARFALSSIKLFRFAWRKGVAPEG